MIGPTSDITLHWFQTGFKTLLMAAAEKGDLKIAEKVGLTTSVPEKHCPGLDRLTCVLLSSFWPVGLLFM